MRNESKPQHGMVRSQGVQHRDCVSNTVRKYGSNTFTGMLVGGDVWVVPAQGMCEVTKNPHLDLGYDLD